MFSEDYVLRMINQAVAALVSILKLKKAGQYREAAQTADQALESLLGVRADLARQMDEAALLDLLTEREELDTARLVVLADLFKESGDIHQAENRPMESRADYARALRFYLEVALAQREEFPSELVGKIGRLETRLADQELPVETQLALYDFYEFLGQKSEAELSEYSISSEKVAKRLSALSSSLDPYLG